MGPLAVRPALRSLTRHAEYVMELTDTILVGRVNRLNTDATSPAAMEKLQAFMQSTQELLSDGSASIEAVSA